MKNLAHIIAIAIFTIFCSAQTMQAQTVSVKPVAQNNGSANATFDNSTEEITLNMVSGDRERVRIMVYDSKGRTFYYDKVEVDTQGVEIIISLAGLEENIYYLRAKGSTISYAIRFKKK